MGLWSEIWDPRSRKTLFRIPDPGTQRHRIPDPQHYSRIRIRLYEIRVLPSSSRNRQLEKSSFLLFYDFFVTLESWSLKTDVNVPSKSNKKKNRLKIYFLLPSWRFLTKRSWSWTGSGTESGSVSLWYGSDSVPKYHRTTTLVRTST